MSAAGNHGSSDEASCHQAQVALDLLGRSRCGAVLAAVLAGSRRYGDIRAGCPGISDAVLAARLRDLCAAGLLERQAHGSSVAYVPTPAGFDVTPVLEALARLVHQHPGAFDRPPTSPRPTTTDTLQGDRS